MPDRTLDFRQIRYALASAEHGSFRKAAVALNIQQSTVSREVRSLEHRIGAELFERSHAGVRPTPAGERFLQEAVLSFDHMRRAVERAGASQRGEYGELTVGVSIPVILLGDVFERFRALHGGVSVEIVDCTTTAGRASVQQRKVDVAFVARTRSDGAPRSLDLRNERMIVVLPAVHPLADADKLRLEDLCDERFILSAGGLGPDIKDHLVRRMASWGVEPRVQLHRASLCNLLTMVARGFGLSILVGPLSRAGPDDVALVPLAGRNVISLCAIWMESNPNPALKGLLNILREAPRTKAPR